jgi:hypothetical protein
MSLLSNSLQGATDAEISRLARRLSPGARLRLLAGRRERTDKLLARPVASFDAGPLLWLTKHTATENPNHEEQGLPYQAGFPTKSYFVPLFRMFLTEKRAFVPKTRNMLTSWASVGYATWRAQWFQWDCIFQTGSIDKVTELIDYAGQLWRHQSGWLRAKHPLATREPLAQELSFAAGGRVKAIPSGQDKIRVFHPTLFILDEAAFLPDAEQCWNAANPAAQQMIAVSSAGPGWFGDECELPGEPEKLEPFERKPEYVTDRKEVWDR